MFGKDVFRCMNEELFAIEAQKEMVMQVQRIEDKLDRLIEKIENLADML